MDFAERTAKLCLQLHDTLKSKNSDYGDSYARSVEKHGKTVVLIRLEDKLNRLEKLLNSEDPALVKESIEDTLLDLAGYAVLELERRQRPKPSTSTELNAFFGKPPYADLDD